MNKLMTTRSQAIIDLSCTIGAILISVILLMLGGLTEVFFFILIAYHVIGGLVNRDIAKSMIGAILLAPVYIGRKIASYIQEIIVEDNFYNLTADDLRELYNAIVIVCFKESHNENEKMLPLYGCLTYGEINNFLDRIDNAHKRKAK